MTTFGAACFQPQNRAGNPAGHPAGHRAGHPAGHRAGLSLGDIIRCANLASLLEGNEVVRKVFVWWCAHLVHKHFNDREVMDAIRQGSTPKAWDWYMRHFGPDGRSSKVPWDRMMEYLQKCGCSLAVFFLRHLNTISAEEAVRRQQAAPSLPRAPTTTGPAAIPRAPTSTGFTAFVREPTSSGPAAIPRIDLYWMGNRNVQQQTSTATLVSVQTSRAPTSTVFVAVPRAPTSTGFAAVPRAPTSTGFAAVPRAPTSTGFVAVPRAPTSTGPERSLSVRYVEGLGRVAVGQPVAEEPVAFVPDVAVRSEVAPAASVPEGGVRSEVAPAASVPECGVSSEEDSETDTASEELEEQATLGKRVRRCQKPVRSWQEMSRPEKAMRLLGTLVSNGKVPCTDEGYGHFRMVVRGGRNGTRSLTAEEKILVSVEGMEKDERSAMNALISL